MDHCIGSEIPGIVYAMILEQLDEGDGYRKRFAVSEIGELANAASWAFRALESAIFARFWMS